MSHHPSDHGVFSDESPVRHGPVSDFSTPIPTPFAFTPQQEARILHLYALQFREWQNYLERVLLPMEVKLQAGGKVEPTLTVHDLAEWLRVSRKSIYRWVRERRLPQPLRRSGRLLLWDRREVERWVREFWGMSEQPGPRSKWRGTKGKPVVPYDPPEGPAPYPPDELPTPPPPLPV